MRLLYFIMAIYCKILKYNLLKISLHNYRKYSSKYSQCICKELLVLDQMRIMSLYDMHGVYRVANEYCNCRLAYNSNILYLNVLLYE